MSDTPDEKPGQPGPFPLPPIVLPTWEQIAAAAAQSLSGLPPDRSGPVHWDHLLRVLWVPNA